MTRRFPTTRMRRMRADKFSRHLMREHQLTPNDLIYPVFVIEGERQTEAIASMPGISRQSIDLLAKEALHLNALGIPAIAIFPVVREGVKSLDGAEAYNPNGLVQRTVFARLRNRFPRWGLSPMSPWIHTPATGRTDLSTTPDTS